MLSLQTPETHSSFLFTKKSQRGESERLGNNSVSLKNKQGFSKSCLFFVALSPLTSLDTPQTHENYILLVQQSHLRPKMNMASSKLLCENSRSESINPPSYKNTIQTASSWMEAGCERIFKTQTFDTIKEIVSTLIQISPRTFHCKQTANKVMLKTSEFPRFEQANV